ncbi:MAG: hypothetical protein JW891_03230 [Candidatus Lokiarchaeota archaeon]|nr:hypothetical protein [Candidatus Lokiarchaeota archaeon]
MENINELEFRAQENAIITKKELVFTNELKRLAKNDRYYDYFCTYGAHNSLPRAPIVLNNYGKIN